MLMEGGGHTLLFTHPPSPSRTQFPKYPQNELIELIVLIAFGRGHIAKPAVGDRTESEQSVQSAQSVQSVQTGPAWELGPDWGGATQSPQRMPPTLSPPRMPPTLSSQTMPPTLSTQMCARVWVCVWVGGGHLGERRYAGCAMRDARNGMRGASGSAAFGSISAP